MTSAIAADLGCLLVLSTAVLLFGFALGDLSATGVRRRSTAGWFRRLGPTVLAVAVWSTSFVVFLHTVYSQGRVVVYVQEGDRLRPVPPVTTDAVMFVGWAAFGLFGLASLCVFFFVGCMRGFLTRVGR